MSKANIDQLLLWDSEGLIPGPNESEEEFTERVAYCKNLKNSFGELLGKEISTEVDSTFSKKLIEDVAPTIKKLFGIVPEWVPIVFTNHRMLPWHGGSAWIFQITDNSPTSAFFQLRKSFETSSKYLGLYDREELLAHESAHIGRMMFEEPKFEEMLAYRTAKSGFRRWFGSIVQSSWESLLFVFVLLLCFLGDLIIAFSGYPDPNHSTLWIKLIPVLLVLSGIIRLSIRHRQFSKCLKKLQGLCGEEKANAIIYRLKDDEIIAFGRMSLEEIKQYATREAEHSLRWQVIAKVYLS